MERVVDVLEHLGGSDRGHHHVAAHALVHRAQRGRAARVAGPDHGDLGAEEIGDRRAFAQEFGIARDAEVASRDQTRGPLQHRPQLVLDAPGQHRAPHDDGGEGPRPPERSSDLACRSLHMIQVQAPVLTAGCADADQHDFRAGHRLRDARRSGESPRAMSLLDELPEPRFHVIVCCCESRATRLLMQIPDCGTGLSETRPGIGLKHAGNNLEQS